MTENDMRQRGLNAAAALWNDNPEASAIVDPRTPEFAAGVLEGLSTAMRSAPGVLRKLVGHASAAAEDLNVEPFHGIVEVLQNADDLGASDVRIAVQQAGRKRRLLIIHNGAPVTCHHVLAMVLPYLTTKSEDSEQKGRFGIGLKTLRRISSRMEVHCSPYHFGAEGMGLRPTTAVAAIPGLYFPEKDTLLALDLLPDFEPTELREWIAAFNEENLLFLNTVERFSLESETAEETVRHELYRGRWTPVPTRSMVLEQRLVTGGHGSWTVYRATLACPDDLRRSHKATADTTKISAAIADHEHASGLFISFRTRVPVSLPFSLDAQFDPSTAREGLIDNPWNRWLVARCGDVLTCIATELLGSSPAAAWRWIPLSSEHAGESDQPWPRSNFDQAFAEVRKVLGESGRLALEGSATPLSDLSYESVELEGLLSAPELESLFPGSRAVDHEARDQDGRWRAVLAAIGVSKAADVSELIAGFERKVFDAQSLEWWIEAGARLAEHAPEGVLNVACWMSDTRKPIAASARESTKRPMVIGPSLSSFAQRWALFERLHEAYSADERGIVAIKWLQRNAEVTAFVDEAGELLAFAEAYRDTPVAPLDEELREIRNRFDQLSDRAAAPIGPKVGQALLLDAYTHRAGKKVAIQAAPTSAYLPRTLDGEYPFWPDAAGNTPDLVWLAPSYDDRLKTAARGRSRRLNDGTVSRGPRKFLLLLGAACWPRVIKVGRLNGGSESRQLALRSAGAEYVEEDYSSPDLVRVLASVGRATRKDRRIRSAALIKALSRYWGNYQAAMRTTAWHMAVKYRYPRGEIDSDWLCRLRDTEWVALSTGTLAVPDRAVIRTLQTQAAYPSTSFVAGVTGEDLNPDFASTVKFITDVRASDLVAALETLRSEPGPLNVERALQAYRALAKQCPASPAWNSKIEDLTISELQRRFASGPGLVFVPSANDTGSWRRPAELLVGRDVLHKPDRFAPGGSSCARLWSALGIRAPGLDDCIAALRSLSAHGYSPDVDATIIDIYRYMEPLVAKADRRQRLALRALPVSTGTAWTSKRPVYYVEDRELRTKLGAARPDLSFWAPPCDVHVLPNVLAGLGLTLLDPTLTAVDDDRAREAGESMRLRFQASVDHLNNELARNDPAAREKLRIPWPALRDIPLSVSEGPFRVMVQDSALSPTPIPIEMDAVLRSEPLHLYISNSAFPVRDRGGRAIAELFGIDVRHRVEAEWVASWVASADSEVQRMTLASDEELERKLTEQAQKIELTRGSKIVVSSPASRTKNAAPPRQLKSAHGGVVKVEVLTGSPPTTAALRKPLAKTAPPSSQPSGSVSLGGPLEYDSRDLEQHAWELLTAVLNNSDNAQLVDFRKRHQVGADGAIDWKQFVELKATGGGLQGSIELSASEFERAQEKGVDYILALVCGLEKEQRTEIRLIFDPVNRVSLRTSGAVRLVGLGDAPAVVIQVADETEDVIAA